MKKKISIILCTYNEVNYVEFQIKLINKTLKNVEIIVVDDNSRDGTLDVLNRIKDVYSFKLIVRKNQRGLASAQKVGFSISSGDFIGTVDVNSKDQILYFPKLISKLESGFDMAFLSRYILGGGDERIVIRSFASKLINICSKKVLNIPYHDFTSGIFLMKRSLLNELNKILTGYSEWFIEFVFNLHKQNIKIVEIPYFQTKDDKTIESKSYPNIIYFIYLGSKYFFRVLIIKLKSLFKFN